MHTEKREDPNPEFNYEVRDVNLKGILKATVWFFGFSIFSAIAGIGIYWAMNPAFHRQEQTRVERRLPEQSSPALLQDNMTTKTDIMRLRALEDRGLDSPPSQNENGTYRIPIEAAMKMVAAQGGKTGNVTDAAVGETRPQPTQNEPNGLEPGATIPLEPDTQPQPNQQ